MVLLFFFNLNDGTLFVAYPKISHPCFDGGPCEETLHPPIPDYLVRSKGIFDLIYPLNNIILSISKEILARFCLESKSPLWVIQFVIMQ